MAFQKFNIICTSRPEYSFKDSSLLNLPHGSFALFAFYANRYEEIFRFFPTSRTLSFCIKALYKYLYLNSIH